MRSNALIALIVSAALLLAGCAAEEAGTPTVDDTTDPGTGGNETVEPDIGDEDGEDGGDEDTGGDQNVTNAPPQASLEASAVNGTAPLNVTFTLDGSDADGDGLAWTFRVNGDEIHSGAELPATVDHTFEAGNHTVELSISDGTDNASAALELAVGEPELDEPYAETFVAEVTVPCMICQEVGAGVSVSWNSGESGIDSVFFELPGEAAGHPFTTTEASDLDSDVEFFSECSPDAESLGLHNSIDAHESGTVPEGAGCAVLWVWYPVGPVDVTLDIA